MYATIAFFFFYTLSHTIGTEQQPKEKTIAFSLAEYVPEVIPPVEEPDKEEPTPEPVEPEPTEEPMVGEKEPEPETITEEVKPEPVVEKVVIKPKPAVKKKSKKKIVKKVKKKKHVVKKKKRTIKKKHKKLTRKRKPSKAKASPAKKNRFLNQLRAKINRNKTYPRIAQRRGMQGSTKVRFTILKSGKVGNIFVSGPKVFHKSAKSAVKKAFPIGTKNVPLSLPTIVNLILHYQLR